MTASVVSASQTEYEEVDNENEEIIFFENTDEYQDLTEDI